MTKMPSSTGNGTRGGRHCHAGGIASLAVLLMLVVALLQCVNLRTLGSEMPCARLIAQRHIPRKSGASCLKLSLAPGDPCQVASVKAFVEALPSRAKENGSSACVLLPRRIPYEASFREGYRNRLIPEDEELGDVIAIRASANGLNVGDSVAVGVPPARTWSNNMYIEANGLILVRPNMFKGQL